MVENNVASINLRSLRTGKEKFYLTIVVLLSIVGWIWILYSVYDQFTSPPPKVTQDKRECIVKTTDPNTGEVSVYSITPEQLFEGERCLSRDELTPDEISQLGESGIPTVSETESKISKFMSSLSTPILIIIFFFAQLFFHLLAVAYIRINAVKLGKEQFPELWESFVEEAKRLGMKKTPDTFVMLGQGAVNAFATRLVFRRIIVFFAELAETLTENEGDKKQLNAVIGHELGHHLLGHTHILNWFLIAESVPFLGSALSRAREYSADRVMKALAVDQEVCERALVKLAAGKRFGQLANIEVFLLQRKQEGGFFAWVAEKLSTHPHLPNRIKALREFSI